MTQDLTEKEIRRALKSIDIKLRRVLSIIEASNDEEFVNQCRKKIESKDIETSIKDGQKEGWDGTDLPEDIQQKLKDEFGTEYLQKHRILSQDGTQVELELLLSAIVRPIQKQRDEALEMHEIIMQSRDPDLIKKYEDRLTFNSEMRRGMGGMFADWVGTDISEDMAQLLDDKFGLDDLEERGIYKDLDGHQIELDSIIASLSDDVVSQYFSYDPKQKAQELGVDYEEFKKDLKEAFKGTVGRPGQPDFGILLDCEKVHEMGDSFGILEMSTYRHPTDKDMMDRMKAKGNDKSEYGKISIRQGQQVIDKGLDAEDVYLVIPGLDGSTPISMEIIAEVVNFQGAAHYLPKEKSR